jgi:hypothetical protein
MSYLSRLIADSPPAPAGRRATSAPARLELDVLREAAVRPAVAIPPADSPMGPELRPFAPRPVPTGGLGLDPTPTVPIPIHRDVAFHGAPSPPRREPEDLARPGGTGADRIAAALPATQPPSDLTRDVIAVVDPERASPAVGPSPSSADPIRIMPVDATTISSGRVEWNETEVATRVIAPPRDERSVDPPSEPAPLAEPARRPSGSLDVWQEAVDVDRRDQQVSLSIGTIEVVVDAPSTPPPMLAPLPPVDAGRQPPALDDPIMRLRRHYVTWPEGR